ncbi:MAG: LutB/LldF family L-lactate oxidation iron-sulfur protein [Planctomycetota bacterium]|nr:LutB/LldF family L-lactate oxidation iron-sulfur protein [Planctomycetota bacterium]
MRPRSDQFHELSSEALEDSFLREALKRASSSFHAAKTDAVDSMPDWEELRQRGHDRKNRAIENLPEALEVFEKNLRSRGGEVHYCEDGASARDKILSIIRSSEGRSVTKSKSMVTEEIDLNDHLEAAGLSVLEGDLGEYILQLAGEHPSHIIAPAIHKSREEVAELFHDHLGSDPDADIPELTRVARKTLREAFLGADIGISGANFVIAETGTIVLVENEGNIRMSTTIPRVHIAVVGIEKVLPRRSDLATLLRLLCRSATGQRVTSYISFISSPRTEGEGDGPEKLHVVFLDAGRSKLWADPTQREALNCIRCGACLNFCPVYGSVGGHSYGWVYPGPIGSVITPHYVGIEKASQLPQASSLCGRCGEVCPVKIPLPDMLLGLRAKAVEAGSAGFVEKLSMRVFSLLARSPRLWRLLLAFGRPFYRLVVRAGLAAVLGGAARRWSRSRTLPLPGRSGFRRWWREDAEKGGE